MYNRLHTILACDGQTDGQTDGQILPRHSPRYAYASRGSGGNQCAICNFIDLCNWVGSVWSTTTRP